ncbi:aldehyde dehydrogenase family protein [Staphylococcus aureus]
MSLNDVISLNQRVKPLSKLSGVSVHGSKKNLKMNLVTIFQSKNVDMFKKALKDVEKELGQDIPLVINGEKIFKDDKIESMNPADTSQVIANASKATKQDVEDAFKATNEAYKSWKTWSANDRQSLCYVFRQLFVVEKRKLQQLWFMKQVSHG